MPKAFTQAEKDLIHAALLEHGERLFSIHGLKKTNVEEIASAAGISKGAFYLFYPSKEALLMDVVEQAETRFREQVLAVVDQPGPSPRLRLYTVLRHAFDQLKTTPILQAATGADLAVMLRRVPPEMVREHMESDRRFIHRLVERCRAAGIPIQIPEEQVHALVLSLLFTILHEQDLAPTRDAGSTAILLELIAAYCLGEVALQAPALEKDHENELRH